jgi:hypothetical protein
MRKRWSYYGINVYPAGVNGSGIRWYAMNAPGAPGVLVADTKDGMRDLIKHYRQRGA